MAEMTGGCACGRIRYTAEIESDDAYLCHCRMCQRATGSVSIAFTNVRKGDVRWDHEPDWYVSSAIARRPYCRECGTSLGFEYPHHHKMDLTVGSLTTVGFPPHCPFRRGKHAPRLDQHRGAAGDPRR
jgi:hypothetical protein